jgi:diphosphomevalonate decarboxylase
MCSKTTVAIDPSFTKDRMWLNGTEETFDNQRLRNCLAEIKARAKSQGKLSAEQLSWPVHICSVNNFPTAAGLASSAAGYACLVYSLSKLYELDGDVSAIARQGSGSACRSVYGGFVSWIAGTAANGLDSIAKQIVKENYWPEMRVLILVVSDNKKKTSSTSGMQNSVATSPLLKYRVSQCVPDRMQRITKAILDKDFETFAQITIQDSNQFHAVCLDTYPPCVYMNDTSHAIADLMHQINRDAGRSIVAYTYDAGPNACLYLLEEHVPTVLAAVRHVFPSDSPANEYYKGIPTQMPASIPKNLQSVAKREPWGQNCLRYIIHTKIGGGPQQLTDANAHLVGDNGLPK